MDGGEKARMKNESRPHDFPHVAAHFICGVNAINEGGHINYSVGACVIATPHSLPPFRKKLISQKQKADGVGGGWT